jgi:2',3'-cyclic-nucleotide 2'-phosphodiesterase (5'-nucleotidase family)
MQKLWSFTRRLGIVSFIALLSAPAQAEPRITIIHTSDLHSHFRNEQSPRKLGGFARVKTKIDEIRQARPDSLLLDSGDWSEGNIFFTLNSGEATQRMLEEFGYDAIVLGNHDWLAGPRELFEAFKASGMKVPVLSANLNFDGLPSDIPLGKYLPPYIVKTVAGKKIGIFGLSTFQLIFDHFFMPVNVLEPLRASKTMVKYLREVEKVDVVIALTHLGKETDAILARMVKGIDIIVGGHSHVLYTEPRYVNGVPIVHTGMWGQHIGEYQLSIDLQGRVSLVGHKIHQVDESVDENARVKLMTDDFQAAVEENFGKGIFKDKIARSEVGMRAVKKDLFSNDVLGNWSTDAIREAAGADVAFDSPMYASTTLQPGQLALADFFNLYPHIYSKFSKDSWTIQSYKVKGYVLRSFVTLLVKFRIPFKVSNAEIVVDGKKATSIRSFKINGQDVEFFREYSVASTRGILDLFTELKRLGLPFLGVKDLKDTGKVMWREVAKKLAGYSPLTPDRLVWTARIRTHQPDPALLKEFIQVKQEGEKTAVHVRVHNSGMQASQIPNLSVSYDSTPTNSVDNGWMGLQMQRKTFQGMLAPGEYIDFEAELPPKFKWDGGFLPVLASISQVYGEVSLLNNGVTNDLEFMPIVNDGNPVQ